MLAMKLIALFGVLGALGFAFMAAVPRTDASNMIQRENVPLPVSMDATEPKPGEKSLIVAGGCFWCLESMFQELKGVSMVESAYVGGARPGITYEDVCGGDTGHAEAVKITYDPKVISDDELLKIFFTIHNPTTLNQQGPDHGTQYRSAIFYRTPEEKAHYQKVMDEVVKAKIWKDPIVTSLEPVKNYTRAEDYHQDYFTKFEKASPLKKMTMNAGYCSAIIEPHVIEFRHKYADRLKKKG